ncbi:rhodanese-like domain-containing protein [Nafulsella turpanensis]|uniref:rhodanese-like domain-containing protein n=1 Tax=Nafulsella turpanensis TaxID=1265690 RepID=UPI00034CAB1A|nr:rhodanese-like domain-containing protein [Nafulsella turpanensis]
MENITAEELKSRLEKGEKLNLIDVREEWEYEEKNIGARLIPLNSLPQQLSELDGLQDEEVIVHCKSGRRSANAQKFLQQQGFKHVRNLEGGIEGYLK